MKPFNELKVLDSKLCKAVVKEQLQIIDIVFLLIEIDTIRGYLDLGYSSLFDYCIRKLKLSNGSSYRRIACAKKLDRCD